MLSSKKGKNKKSSPVPAADPLSSPVASRRNDAGRLPSGYRVPQPSSAPPGDVSPAGSKGSQDLKIDEVSKGSATSELTSASRDLQGNNIEAMDSQLREYADAVR